MSTQAAVPAAEPDPAAQLLRYRKAGRHRRRRINTNKSGAYRIKDTWRN